MSDILSDMTHYTDLGGFGTFLVFEMGVCEHCDGSVQEANALRVHVSREYLERRGLKYVQTLPPELDVADDGTCHCGCLDESNDDVSIPDEIDREWMRQAPPRDETWCCPHCGSTAGAAFQGYSDDCDVRMYTCRHCGSEINVLNR